MHHDHPDFEPGFVICDGVAAFFVDELGQEWITTEGMEKICEVKNEKMDNRCDAEGIASDEKKRRRAVRGRPKKSRV